MGKLIGAIILILICFTAGYLVGARKLGPLEEKLAEARNMVFEQKTDLVKKLDKARLRLRLAELKEQIGDARADVIEKNYGKASERIRSAREILNSLLGDADPELRKELTPIVVGLDETRVLLDKMDNTAKSNLETLRNQISEIQKKQTD